MAYSYHSMFETIYNSGLSNVECHYLQSFGRWRNVYYGKFYCDGSSLAVTVDTGKVLLVYKISGKHNYAYAQAQIVNWVYLDELEDILNTAVRAFKKMTGMAALIDV